MYIYACIEYVSLFEINFKNESININFLYIY